MKYIISSLMCMAIITTACTQTKSSFRLDYDPTVQATGNMNYFRPNGNLFVGDCIPFYHNETFYLYWLIDSGHHSALNGLGGHQWVLSTSEDLRTWKHFPVVLGIEEEWEKSICTGSLVYYDNKFYAFYATRSLDASGRSQEQLSYAVSDDGIHFKKQQPNPFYTYAPGYSKQNFRDAKVSVDETGKFHLFISSEEENSSFYQKGALVHMVSGDLKNWEILPPVASGLEAVPECPDYFYWNGWYYLMYSTHSETYYLMSRQAYGPWSYPPSQVFKENWSNVVKTAAFTNNRRIAAGWVPWRKDNKDDGWEMFGGNALLREVVQENDGTLSTKFVPEAIPATTAAIPLSFSKNRSVQQNGTDLSFNAGHGLVSSYIQGVPTNCRITMEVASSGGNDDFGLYLRANQHAGEGYRLSLSANNGTVILADTKIEAVPGLQKPIRLDIIMKDDIIDVSIDNRRCIVNRLPQQKGDFLWLYAKFGTVVFRNIKVMPLK